MTTFLKFNFDPKLFKILPEIGYETPTPIQELAIPKILEGVDIIASAHTGTGKTAAFMLPILQMLSDPDFRGEEGPQVLILVPTRELAMQVAEEAKKFSKYMPRTKTVCIYGGVPYPLQRRMLSSRYEILVATPGRLIDHLDSGQIDLSNVKMLVLDEADRMLDMGFIDAVDRITEQLSPDRQTLLFSATIDNKILPVSKRLQRSPCQLEATGGIVARENIEQRLYYVDGIGHKMRLLEHLLENGDIEQSIVFTSTIQQANQLAMHLQERDYHSAALHGDMNQRQRTRIIDKLRRGQCQILIATDVASRGIDISTLTHIINFDLPFQPEDFVHRIGRTGRAGAKGTAITFATYSENPKLARIHTLIGKQIEQHTVVGLEPKPPTAMSMAARRPKGGSRWGAPGGRRFGNGTPREDRRSNSERGRRP